MRNLVFQNGGFSFAGKLVFPGKLVSQEKLFFVNYAKTFIFILMVKHVTCNAKVCEIISFWDSFSKN